MDPRHLELAEEFGRITGKADLIEYLGLPAGATADEARAALRARRKKMQGMQSNPKYRREAVFLIKNSASFDRLLEDLDAYRDAARATVEAAQLPILEMAIKGALSGGALSAEQRGHVEGMAEKLGIRTETFERTLSRLTAEQAPVKSPPPAPQVASAAPTAPPVRSRTHGPPSTRPPSLSNVGNIGQTLGLDRVAPTPQIEIIGDPIRYVTLGRSPVVHEIRVRQRGKTPSPARVSADAGWLTVSPKILDPSRREQTISVHVDPTKVTNPPQSAVVHIVTETDGRASIVFEAIETAAVPNRTPLYIGLGVAAVLVVLAILYSQGIFGGAAVP